MSPNLESKLLCDRHYAAQIIFLFCRVQQAKKGLEGKHWATDCLA